MDKGNIRFCAGSLMLLTGHWLANPYRKGFTPVQPQYPQYNPYTNYPPRGSKSKTGAERSGFLLFGKINQTSPSGEVLVYIELLTVEIRISPATTRSSAANPSAKLSE